MLAHALAILNMIEINISFLTPVCSITQRTRSALFATNLHLASLIQLLRYAKGWLKRVKNKLYLLAPQCPLYGFLSVILFQI